MSLQKHLPKSGDMILLVKAPPELLHDLPSEDQKAISDIVGKPILLVGFDDYGNAELEFNDSDGMSHTIWVDPSLIKVVESIG
jgi:hypothetical protein